MGSSFISSLVHGCREKSRRYRHKFSFLPIHRQFLAVSLLCMLMVMLLTFLLLQSAQRIIMANVTSYAELFTEKYTNQLETLCLQLDVLCSEFQTNEVYRKLLSAESYQELAPEIIDAADSTVTYIKSLNTNIADVAFANDLIHWSTLFSEDDLSVLYRHSLQDDSSGGRGIGLMKSSFLPLADKTYYVYCSNIYQYGTPLGCVFISLDIDRLNLDDSATDSPASFFIMDTGGKSYGLSSNSNRFAAAVLEACQNYAALPSEGGVPSEGLYNTDQKAADDCSHEYTVNHDSFSIQMTYSETANCYIISAVYIPAIRAQLSDISYYIWFILAAIVLFAVLLMTVLYRNMAAPLNQFNNIIEEIRSQRQRHLKYPLDIQGCAEVHNLALAFSNMFSDIDKLNMQIFDASARLYEEKIRTQATQLDYFRSQINPHFLYNVLEMIRSLALTNHVPEIASIAVAVGKMYRYNIKGDPVVPFREELEMTKAYIEIQKSRFQNKFEILYNIPDEALDIPVIKLILQPLVENAIQHGIEPALEHCILYIGCTLTEKDMLIEIRDDGVGMPRERLREMQALLAEKNYDTANYVGITNTNARLKLQYGEEYGITLDGEENDGTVVTIRIPIIRTQQGSEYNSPP